MCREGRAKRAASPWERQRLYPPCPRRRAPRSRWSRCANWSGATGVDGRRRHRLLGRPGRGVRLPRSQRCRQVDDHQDALHLRPADRRHATVAGFDVTTDAEVGATPHRPRLPGADPRRPAHRGGEPPIPRRALRRAPATRSTPASPGCSIWSRCRTGGRTWCRPTRAEWPVASRSPGACSTPPGPLPRRAHGRARPADPGAHLGGHHGCAGRRA